MLDSLKNGLKNIQATPFEDSPPKPRTTAQIERELDLIEEKMAALLGKLAN